MAYILPVARMYPERPKEETPHSERRIFESLKNQLDDNWVVFHSVAWIGRSTGSSSRDGEADFVVAHPDKGILVIEVKGGTIERDAASGVWRQNSDEMGDPFEQAMRSKKALLAKIQEAEGHKTRWIAIGHAVAFPDVDIPQGGLGPNAPDDIILNRSYLPHVSEWIESAIRFHAGSDSPPGRVGIERLRTLLGSSWKIRPPLVAEDREAEFLELTERQYSLLDVLSRQRRCAISGCAGSGKTFLAIEKVRRLAAEGLRVLYICYNKGAAGDAARALEGVEGAESLTFHSLCTKFAEKASVPHKGPRENPEISEEEFFSSILPNALMEATDRISDRYDAIVADEAQDFKGEWWQALQMTLVDPDESILYVFYDDNQAIYGEAPGLPVKEEPFLLAENLRNTKEIHSMVSRFYRGKDPIKARGPHGQKPRLLFYKESGECVEHLRKALHDLVHNEKVSLEDLVVISPRSERTSVLWKGEGFGNLSLTRSDTPGANEVRFQTVHAFKGRECPVVIVAEVDLKTAEELLYVGLSRPKQHLVVIANEDLRERLGG